MNITLENTKILITEEQIALRIAELAKTISHDYKDKELAALVVLKGAMIFASDLLRGIDSDLIVSTIKLSSYEGVKSSGSIKVHSDIDINLTNKDVLIIEDIIDSGQTYEFLKQHLTEHHRPRSIKLCTLLDKPEALTTSCKIDYLGFSIGKEFVIGYGLDYDQRFRNLPNIRQVLEHD